MRLFLIPAIIGTVILTSGCETLDDDIARFETMNCYQLAKETGRYEQMLKKADDEETMAILDQLASDNKKEKEEAETDEILASIDKDAAKDRLNALQQIARNKNCGF